jgi:hypothetical protein
MPTPICKLKRVNPSTTATPTTPTTTSTTLSKTLEEDAKKLLETRKQQDNRYFPTLPLPSHPHTPGVLRK